LRLRQNYNRVGLRLVRRIGGYAHAKQFRRMRSALKKLKVRVGRMVRDIERQLEGRDEQIRDAFARDLALAHRVINQKRTDKNKLYSLHAPEVECISKSKAHKRNEFGVKASFATTHRSGFVVGALHCTGNPYDGHTLKSQLEQVKKLTGVMPARCFADKGYRGHGVTDIQVFISGQRRSVTRAIRRELKRRSAIEPEIGHMKSDGHLGRCFLKGAEGDAMNILMVAFCALFTGSPDSEVKNLAESHGPNRLAIGIGSLKMNYSGTTTSCSRCTRCPTPGSSRCYPTPWIIAASSASMFRPCGRRYAFPRHRPSALWMQWFLPRPGSTDAGPKASTGR